VHAYEHGLDKSTKRTKKGENTLQYAISFRACTVFLFRARESGQSRAFACRVPFHHIISAALCLMDADQSECDADGQGVQAWAYAPVDILQVRVQFPA
jgi:hypothetical protein